MNTDAASIPITFDKSHLTTIGTRLYAESLDLVRELVANAYDADATRVDIQVAESELAIIDNGGGMDRKGLKQYFTIGSEFKRNNPITPLLKRQRIGEFGIGKFAVLALCNRFLIYTKKNGYGATVIFDREQFEASDSWEVPILEQPSTGKNGTKISLSEIKYPVPLELLERKLRQQLPLRQKNFSVYINGSKLAPHVVPGRRFKIRQATEFGLISGEIILSSLLLPTESVGIAIKVKGMTIKREMFGLDNLVKLPSRRLTGEIAADFLIPTSSRDNLLKENQEYKIFWNVIKKKLKRIAREVRKLSLNRLDLKTDEALSTALQNVKKALKKNPDIFLLHDLPLFTGASSSGSNVDKNLAKGLKSAKIGPDGKKKALAAINKVNGALSKIKNKEHKNLVRTVLKDKNRIIKRLKIGGVNLTCSLSNMGKDEVESFVEGGIIFINRDHPLFAQTARDEETLSYHLLRLITQELVKLTNPPTISQAYDWQSRLLTSAVIK